ncbi:hypothetical protein [Ascidiimonas aurantiaca]|uniref:hypothetical protein n=1 Tax=Ascidiimonas aurantiaca TaxID=1685432 RepID=UPI0030EB8AD4
MVKSIDLVPKKTGYLEVYPFKENEYVLHQNQLGYHINVNQDTVKLLDLVDNSRTVQEITQIYSEKEGISIEPETVYDLLFQKLAKYGIIESHLVNPEKKQVASYLKLSFTLIKDSYITFFTRILKPIIPVKRFYMILFAFLGISFGTLIYNYKILLISLDSLSPSSWGLLFLLAGGFLFLHEFGHATTCAKFGATHGHIGFGFYLFTPVMYADVSDIWRLDKYKRVLVNLSGIYMDSLMAALLSGAFWITGNGIFLIIAGMLVLNTFKNLNPFLRYDGYWVLSDMTEISNLRHKSNQLLGAFVRHLFSRKPFIFSKTNLFLVSYAFISIFFILIVLTIFVLKDPNHFLRFPIVLVTYLQAILTGQKTFVFSDLYGFVLPALLYYLVGKLVVSAFLRWFRKRPR